MRVGLSHSVVTACVHVFLCPAFGAMVQKTRLTEITYSMTADSGGVGVLVGCALRTELADLEVETIQQREGRWILTDR